MFKLIAVDMDGTLLNDNHKISLNTIQTLKEVKRHGIKIVLCTGRPINGLNEYKEILNGLIDYTVSYNGGLIEDVHNEVYLRTQFMDYKQL